MASHKLYNTAWRLATPLGKLWLKRGDHAALVERFNPRITSTGKATLWVHACSLGEVNTAKPLLDALKHRYPRAHVLLTVSTQSGLNRAQELLCDSDVTWCPFDTPAAVKKFYDQLQPIAVFVIESEFWPNLFGQAKQRGIPLILVNGRISDKHLVNYKKWKRFYRPIFNAITLACMQSDRAAERARELGTPPDRVCTTGNIKFDGARIEASPKDRALRQRMLGLGPGHPLLLFGSTRPGDEALASACWMTLREEHPTMKLMLAPRHLDRVDEVLALFTEPVFRFSDQKNGKLLRDERVILLDTMGELGSFYAIATIAVIGGSFYPPIGGHNPIESAALGVPTIFGPYMENFLDPAQTLTQARGAIQVSCTEDLYECLSGLLKAPAELRQLGTRGRKAVLDAQGALARTLEAAEKYITLGD